MWIRKWSRHREVISTAVDRDGDEEFHGIAVTVKRELGIVHAAVGNVARRGRLIVDADDGPGLGRYSTRGCGRSRRV